MGVQFGCAKAVGAVATWGLRTVLHREAGNFPGVAAMRLDPHVIGHSRTKMRKGSFLVVGTNGKTTTTLLLADVLEAAGDTVICNRSGANLASGIATALLQNKPADWGVFECDELWLARALPELQASYVILLDLFLDQLDRYVEISIIQKSIIGALESSPDTVLIYNADDPNCAFIADSVPNPRIAFGVDEDMHLPAEAEDPQMCQRCNSMLQYAFRQYSQIGNYTCPTCGFGRGDLDYAVRDVSLGATSLGFTLFDKNCEGTRFTANFAGSYMVYNLAAVATGALLAGASDLAIQEAVDTFDPKNGRLQTLQVKGRKVLLNLAKNPTGFNQNLKIVLREENPCTVGFFVNDAEGDGRDPSWLWDIEFEGLAAHPQTRVLVGGIRSDDLVLRLKYAGVEAAKAATAAEVFAAMEADADLPADAPVYLIANYTALPPIRAELNKMEQAEAAAAETPAGTAASSASLVPTQASADACSSAENPQELQPLSSARCCRSRWAAVPAAAPEAEPVRMAWLLPDLLAMYSDGGNLRVLEQRLAWRGIPFETVQLRQDDDLELSCYDLVLLCGGADREQAQALSVLKPHADQISAFVESDGALLAVCGGYQMLGRTCVINGQEAEGLGVLDMESRPAAGGKRMISDIAVVSDLSQKAVIGYENHASCTYLGAGCVPFGRVASSVGCGNTAESHTDGVLYRKMVGTYLHGPVLAKNPDVADALLEAALARWANRVGVEAPALVPLDDAVELAANAFMARRLNV